MDNNGLIYLLNLSGQALEQANGEIGRLAARVAELESQLGSNSSQEPAST